MLIQYRLVTLLLMVTMFSCKKNTSSVDEPVQTNSTGTPLTFSVSAFSQSTSTFSTASPTSAKAVNSVDAIKAGVTKIHYVVFDQSGNEVSRLEQNVKSPNSLFRVKYRTKSKLNDNTPFGSLKDTLKQGTYSFYVAATTEETANINRPQSWAGQDFYYSATLADSRIYPSGNQKQGDFFLYKGQLTVGASPMSQTVTLDRMVGKLEMVIQDALPTGSNRFEIVFETENEYLQTATLKPGGEMYDNVYQIHDVNASTESGKPNFTRSWTFLNTATPMTMTIRLFNSGKLVATKFIPNVKITANQKTTVTGKLLESGPTSGSFGLLFNQDWSTTGNTIKF